MIALHIERVREVSVRHIYHIYKAYVLIINVNVQTYTNDKYIFLVQIDNTASLWTKKNKFRSVHLNFVTCVGVELIGLREIIVVSLNFTSRIYAYPPGEK